MRNALLVLAFAASLLLPRSALASAFGVSTHDARATALGLSLTADADDAAAVYFNPAGIVQGQQLQVRLGDTVIVPMFQATPAGTTDTANARRQPVPPPHVYATYGFTDDASLGIGFFVPYGMSLSWQDDWVGRTLATSSTLTSYYLNPEVAYRLFNRLRIGAGVQIVRSTIDLKRRLDLVDSEAAVDMGGAAWGVGGNAGLQLDLLTRSQGLGLLTFGLSYRSPVSLSFKGDVHFSDVPAEFSQQLKDQSVTSAMTMPQTLALGLAYQNTFGAVGARLGASTEYAGWQTFHDLTLSFEDASLSQTLYKRAHHTWSFAVGLELDYSKRYFVRLGFNYDPTPFPPEAMTPDLPDGNRTELCAGLGLRWAGFQADLGYMAVLLEDFESTYAYLPATYGGTVHVVGLTLGYAYKL